MQTSKLLCRPERSLELRQLRIALWEQSTTWPDNGDTPNKLLALDAIERMRAVGRSPGPANQYRPMRRPDNEQASADLLRFVGERRFKTVLADPPWRFMNRTGKVAPEHHRLSRYGTLTVEEIAALPIHQAVDATAHLYLWVSNALLPEGLQVLRAWGFGYKSNIVWHKLHKDGGSDGRGVGFYFRNVTELLRKRCCQAAARSSAFGLT